MTDIEQFVPNPIGGLELDLDRLQESTGMSDDAVNQYMNGFLAMRSRVENPRRRIGGDVARKGPVLFDPCHYVR